jgi:hypothetical protein
MNNVTKTRQTVDRSFDSATNITSGLKANTNIQRYGSDRQLLDQLLDGGKKSASANAFSSSKSLDNSGWLFSDHLNVSDATSNDSLFNLGSSNVGARATTLQYRARSTYDPIDYGDPLTDAAYWRQQSGNASCTVVAQISIYESLTGYRISETDACNYAEAKGWFNPQTGTSLRYTGMVLNAFGITTYGGYNATLNYLATALSNGDKPIVGLDANEIWNPKRDRYGNPVEQRNLGHTVWVTGIDVKPSGRTNIILNDSGTPYGRTSVVSYTDFKNAWQDMNYFVTVADNPYV